MCLFCSQLTYHKISPTLKEIAFIRISSEKGAGDTITFSEIAVDEDENDIFTSTPPRQIVNKKGEGKKQVDVSMLPPKKKRRQHDGESCSQKIHLKSLVVSTKANTNVSQKIHLKSLVVSTKANTNIPTQTFQK